MEQNLSAQTLPNSLSNHQDDDEAAADDNDPPSLSLQALEALKEFLAEQSQPLPDTAAESRAADSAAPALISEDWRLSQFWYDPHTAETLAQEVLTLCNSLPDSAARVACVACPSLYAYLKNNDSEVPVQLLEYDKRFEQYGSDFTFYDYNRPEDLPLELKHAFDIVVADPPYLSRECLEKVAQTVSFLARSEKSYLLLLTGAVQKERAAELMGLHPCGFRPQHSSKLGNEFRLFTNYDPAMRLEGWDVEK
ncbi:hypothetical protein PRUPE_7G087000 [Prunus persica]|uniref:Protein-lysine N-methyltransferase PRUPE_7G087000 n=1 Tax=Prunus persica TaxID=3760 RepID=M5VQT6_PRUPE|nr:protein-lysine N-methyltransferase N6AMT2 [Prunus persica]ONH95715.1 hypothetical protein PRUPE_7G087000 [Prunus persica]